VTNELATAPAIEIFYSYAHEDRVLRQRLENHLKVLQRQGLIAQWTDRVIAPGTQWDREINEALDRAQIILFLLSEWFLASEYIDGVEMRRAFERAGGDGVRIIPVILRECLWRDDQRLAALEPLPHNRRPVAGWRDRAAAFAEVASGIKGVAQELVPRGVYGVSATIPLPANAGPRIEALPSVWNVPQRRDPAFVDQEATLATLAEALAAERAGGSIVAVVGPPGIGKTSLVTEFAYRHAADYDVVWWVRADHLSTVASDLPALAGALHLPAAEHARDRDELWLALRPWLESSGRYLLIVDDASDPSAVLDELPPVLGGHVLLTFRDEVRVPPRARKLDMAPFTHEASVDFLRRKMGEIDPVIADGVARRLEGSPLALGIASSYLSQDAQSADEFLGALDIADARDPKTGADAALELVVARVEDESPPAADLLRLISFFAPEDIPLDELANHGGSLNDPIAAAIGDRGGLDDLVATLERFELAWRAGDAFSLHRHVQSIVAATFSDEARRRWSATAVSIVESAFPEDSRDVMTWRSCARLAPHALTAVEHAELIGSAALESGRLLRRLAVYFIGRAQLDTAASVAARALAIHEATLGRTNAEVATDLVVLGRVYQAMDNLEAAREPFERAVAINELVLGANDPKVAHDLTYLGRFLRRIGDLPAAERTLRRAVSVATQAHGAEDRNVGFALGHLGRVLQDERHPEQAEPVLQQALAIDEAALGPDHADVATDLVNLARVQRELGQLDAAEANLRRALATTRRRYGADHYEVAIVEANLGRVAQARGDRVTAELHLLSAVEILQASVGDEHSYTKTAREWLASARAGQTGAVSSDP
jgi:tetratricopeptide (TPR) repeat protein